MLKDEMSDPTFKAFGIGKTEKVPRYDSGFASPY